MIFDTNSIDQVRFSEALGRVALEEKLSDGFTVYSEGSVHKALKLYIEPRAEFHEIPMLGGVADVYNENGVFEVQTGSFIPLLPKLKRFLPLCRVTLVHPFCIRASHRWLDPESGEISVPISRGSARSPYSVGKDLYSLSEFIGHPNLTVMLLAYECDEYRRLDGRDKSKKRGATLLGKIPTRLVGEIVLKEKDDYKIFIPDSLGESFTAKEYLSATKCRSRYDRMAIKLLIRLGLIDVAGKSGRAVLYKRV